MSSSGTQIAFGAAAAVALGLGYLSYNNSRKATPFTATHGQTLPTAGPPAGVKGVDVFSANYIEPRHNPGVRDIPTGGHYGTDTRTSVDQGTGRPQK